MHNYVFCKCCYIVTRVAIISLGINSWLLVPLHLLLYIDIDDEIFKKLPVGRHTITFQFTPTGSSQPLPLTPQEFIIRPTSKLIT